MKVSVFGGSQTQSGSEPYKEAVLLGEMLAEAGHTVLTGGYMGTMEAVSKGASSRRGHVIGVTCEEIGRWHHREANAWVAEEWKRHSLLERLETLIRNADAAIAMPGGPGTLAEVALMWNLMIVGSLGPRPLILVGREWTEIFNAFHYQLGDYTPVPYRGLLHFAPGAVEAVHHLVETLGAAPSPATSGPDKHTTHTEAGR